MISSNYVGMKLYLSEIGSPETEQTIVVQGWRGAINTLVFIHIGFFLLFTIARMMDWMSAPWQEETLSEFVNHFLAISGNAPYSYFGWLSGILIHQFVHTDPLEFMFSVSMFWFFGHLLKARIGERNVIVLYLTTITLSGVVFIISHLVFRVFSGHGTVMDGSFAGALAVMTSAAVLLRPYQVRLGKMFIPVWQIYAVILPISIALLFKPSIAYVIVYVFSIWSGLRYGIVQIARWERKMNETRPN